MQDELPPEIERLECSYIYDAPAVHSNLFIWAKDGSPVLAFAGSANFVQSSFVGKHRQEVMNECNPQEALEYYQSLIDRSIYAHHAEIEEYVVIHPAHAILDLENELIEGVDLLSQDGYQTVTLSLITRAGEPGRHSGLNWGNGMVVIRTRHIFHFQAELQKVDSSHWKNGILLHLQMTVINSFFASNSRMTKLLPPRLGTATWVNILGTGSVLQMVHILQEPISTDMVEPMWCF